MGNLYYEHLDRMEKAGVDGEYLNGWAAGFLRNPPRGEQFLNDAYEAGYKDGESRDLDAYTAWLQAARAG